VAAVTMIRAGFTGVADALDGERNALDALRAVGGAPEPERLVEALGERFYIEETAIKTYPVGYPIQAPLDALLSLVREQRLKPDDVRRIVARLPADGASIVNDRAMPDVNCQHILAVALVDGALTLESSHARERMTDPRVLAVRERVELVADPLLVNPAAPRSGRVEVTLADGRTLERFVRQPPGTPENPLDDAGVNGKARGLIEPVLGAAKTDALIRRVNALEQLADARELRVLLAR
jgi:2-methylcitrate dehydratase PrpD